MTARVIGLCGGASGLVGWRRSACRESARGSFSDAVAASTDACGRHMPGALMRRACRWTTRITGTGLAARNRRARFPASRRVGMLRIAPADEPTRTAEVIARVSPWRMRASR